MMQIGIDSYCYHRRYGEIRPGERPPIERPWPRRADEVIKHATTLGVEWLFLETCYLPEPDALRALPGRDSGMHLGFSWGHPWPQGAMHGLDGGRSQAAVEDAMQWIEVAGRLRHPLMRITAGSPVSRGADPSDRLVERLVEPLRRVTSHAEAAGVRLALENHGDLSSVEILALLSLVSSDALGVCLDNINLIRVGDDMATGSRLLAPHAFLVQLKDCLDGDPRVPGGPISTALGEGSVNLVRVLEILRGAAFAGPVCIEFGSLGPDLVNEFAMLGRSVAWLEAQTVFFSTTRPLDSEERPPHDRVR